MWPQFFPGLNPTFTPILAFYRDLSVAGVVIGMALLGMAARVLYAWFRAWSDSFAVSTACCTFSASFSCSAAMI